MSLLDLVSKVKKHFTSPITDDKGWVRKGKFVPAKNLKEWIKQVQPNISRLRNVDIASTSVGGMVKAFRQPPKNLLETIVPPLRAFRGAYQNIKAQKPSYLSEQVEQMVPGKWGSALGLAGEIALPNIGFGGGDIRAGTSLFKRAGKVALKSAPLGAALSAAEAPSLKQVPKYALRGGAFSGLFAGGLTVASPAVSRLARLVGKKIKITDLASKARKYKSAEEFVRDDFQKRVIAGQDLVDDLRGAGIRKTVNSDGTITIYHGTSQKNADNILKFGKIDDSTFFSPNKSGTAFGDSPLDVAKRKFGKEGTVIEIKVDPRDIGTAAAGSELFAEKALIRTQWGIWQAVDRKTGKQLTDIYNQATKTKPQKTIYAKIKRPKVSIPEVQKSKARKILDKSSDEILTQAKKEIGTVQVSKKTFKQTANEFYTNWVNRFEPIERLTRKIEKEQKIKILPKYSPEYTTRQLLGVGGTAELRHKKALQPILDLIDNNKIELDDMDVFLKAKRDIGFEEVGRKIKGSDSIKAKATIEALGGKYDLKQLDDIAQKIYVYQDEGLRKLLDSGFIDQKGYDAIKAGNKYYVPFQRVMDEVDNYLGVPTRTAQAGQPIKKIKGSKRQILSPIESIIADTYKIESAVAKNRVATSVIGLKDIAPEYANMFTKTSKSGQSTIFVWENGKKVHYKVGREIADMMKGLNEESAGMLVKILSAPARLLRQGATGRNIDFMIPNMFKDQLDASITSKYGYKPFLDYLRGLGHLINYRKTGSDELVESWMKSGGSIFFENMSGRKGIKEQIQSATQKRGVLKKLKDWALGGIDVVGEYSEVPTRLGLYKKALEKTKNPLIAMMESREGTLDFARMGSKMKTLNSIIPFLNVGVQGFDKLVRATKNNPAKVGMLFATYAGIPAIATSLYNNLYHPEELSEIPAWVKDTNFVVIKGRKENGKVDYLKFPKGNVVPYVANPTEELITWMAGNDTQGFGEMAISLLSEGLPVIKGGSNLKEVVVRTFGGNLPQAIKPLGEDIMNKSFFRTTPKGEPKEIVPYYFKDKPAHQQAFKHTPEAYKAVGKILNVSPLRAKNFLEGTFAGMVKTPVGILETLKKISQGEEVDPNIIPVLRRFYGETYKTKKTIKIKKDVGRFETKAAEELPTDLKSLQIIYKDAVKTVEGYGEKKIKIKHGISKSDLTELQSDVDQAIKIKKEIESQKPEIVFKIGLDTYKSGGGMSVKQRAEWAKEQIQSKKGVNSLIKKYFPKEQWQTAQAVMMAESGGRASAIGDNYPIKGQTIPSYGLFQIRALPGRPSPEQLKDPEFNVKYAAEMFRTQGWQPWSAYKNGSYKRYLGMNQEIINKLWESKVLTSGKRGTAEALKQMGIDVTYTGSGKYGKKAKKAKKITIKKATVRRVRTSKFVGGKRLKAIVIKPPPQIRIKGIKARKLKLPQYTAPTIKITKLKGLQQGIKLV